MPLKACLVCGRLTPTSRCPAHTRRSRTGAEQRRRTQVVHAWVEAHGWVCPGWGRDPHESRDLTADHVIPVSRGGSEDGVLAVLCRGCNSRKHNH